VMLLRGKVPGVLEEVNFVEGDPVGVATLLCDGEG
jgi:hypothetical protein